MRLGEKKNVPQLGFHSAHPKEDLSSGSEFLPCGYVPCTGEGTILRNQQKVA